MKSSTWFVAISVSASFLAACGNECRTTEPDGVAFRFAATADADADFFAHPWPSDARRRPDGTLKLSRWPNPTESSTLEEYLQVIGDETRGFGRSTASYVTATGAIDPSSLPQEPLHSTVDSSGVYLVDIDADSPDRGRLFPLKTRFSTDATLYLPENHLIVQPPFGVPLRPDNTYALVGTNALRAADGSEVVASKNITNSLRAKCEAEAPAELFGLLAPLRRYFEDNDKGVGNVVFASVFTTADTMGEIRRIGDAARAEPSPELQDIVQEAQRDEVTLFRGTIQMPGFQSGTVPYAKFGDGGGINWGPDGVPLVDHYETTRVGIMIPRRAMPATGWPVVLMSHGTGADYKSAFDPEVATALALKGIAVVSYDPTLHGPRDPTGANEDLTFFNLFNILAGRDNVRQGAVDCVVMTKMIANGLEVPRSVTGGSPARFDASKIAFLGHSQGGLVGSPCVAVEPAFKAVVFSGTAGVLTITLLERKSPVDFLALIRSLLMIPNSEPMDDLHPILNLMQTFIEPADPIAYAPSYLTDPPDGANRDILYVEGFKDSASPARGHEALATAAGVPLIAPFFRLPEAAALVGPSPNPAPAATNVQTTAGMITAGLIQYPERDHWPIFNDFDANARYVEFIRSALFDGRARIIETQHR